MSTLEEYRSRLNKAAVIIKDLTSKLDATQKKLGEPIAVIGMACRFPANGANPEAFWQTLEAGVDGIRRISAERWPADALDNDNPATRWAGLLEGIDRFDAAFFGISPREATKLDPQQRLLLEVSWEALERSGQPVDKLLGSRTGVFLGMCTADYQSLICNAPPYDVYSGLGATFATASGRISYILGLQGPCVTLDTACSSSLTAAHFACQSLHNGESDMALAGGVNLILTPTSMKMVSEMQALSPDGRCKTFDAEANGFVRGEGCGIIVLKRLSDAKRDGDSILAIIRGSVVNQDGRSTGLTAPNVLSQQAMLRRALEVARIQPEDIGYVETHGTGTSLGDPIEFESMREVLGKPRNDGSTCVLGALKTNVGHMEGAAGIGGLIKAILCLQHEAIPKNLHFNTLNPRLSLEGTPFVIPTETIPWKPSGKPRRAGVSSFGISGTNAHVILEEAPRREEKPFLQASSYLLPLSAKTPEALSALAKSYQEWLLQHDEPLQHVAYTASVRRNHLEYRLSVSGATTAEIAAILGAFVAGEMPPRIVTGKAAQSAPKVVFVFPGQGSQWIGMGRQLYREEPVFRDALEACNEAIRKEAGFSVVEELHKPEETSRLQETIVAQPALFAIEVSLSALLQSWGITPSAVIGHSVGEIAAAHVAGLLDMEQAAHLVCIRARVMQKATGHGKMVSVSLSEEDARKAIAGLEDRVGIAAVNDTSSVVLSGNVESIDSLVEKFTQNGVKVRQLRVNYAFHSPQMETLVPEFMQALGEVVGKPGSVPMLSTVTGKVASNERLGATYWAQNIRQTVRFADAIRSVSSSERHLFVEVGPHPVLGISMEQTLAARNNDDKVVATLRREKDERTQALLALGALHVHGYTPDWKSLFPEGSRVVALPTYPWQRQRYWLESSNTTTNRPGEATGHPLLGVRVPAAGTIAAFETVLSLDRYPWLADHRVAGQVLVPAAAMVELIRAASSHGNGHTRLKNLVLLSPLVLPETGGRRVQVILGDGGSSASLYSQPLEGDASAPWTLHSTAIVNDERGDDSAVMNLPALQSRCTELLEPSALYERFARMGLAYGPHFRGLKRIWRGEGEAIAEIALLAGSSIHDYGLHPALLDAAFQTMIAVVEEESDELALPFEIGEFSLHQYGANAAWVHARWDSANALSADITLCDPSGAVIVNVLSYRTQRAVARALVPIETQTSADVFYRINWRESGLPGDVEVAAVGRWIVVAGPDADRAAAIADKLSDCVLTTSADLSAALERNVNLAGVLCIWETTNDENPANGALHLSFQALSVVQTLQTHRHAPRRLLWVTTAAIGFTTDEAITPALGSLWGLGRTVLQEQPERGLRLMDVAPDMAIDAIVREMATDDDETQVVWRNGRRHVARLVRALIPASDQVSWPKEGTVLITGGLGALGLHVARWFARHGVPNLLLTGRRGMDTPGAIDAVAELQSMGAAVTVAAVDVTDRDALQALVDAIPKECALRGIVHAAGVLDDGVIGAQNEERFAKVFAPKVKGAWNLHEMTVGQPLDFFVLFSSLSGLLGAAGQSNYAAANTFLDALAVYRRTLGLAGQSIAWGAWSEGGMAAALGGTQQARLSKQGFKWISSDEGMVWFEKALTMPEAVLGIVPLDVTRLEQSFGEEIPPVWRALMRTRARPSLYNWGSGSPSASFAPNPTVAQAKGTWAVQLASLSDAQRLHEVRTAVQTDVARVLGISGAIRSNQPFNEMGLDSLMAVELRNALAKRLGKTLPATLAFDYPTVEVLTRYLLDDVLTISEAHTRVVKSITAITTDEPIAIVGMGCRYPGGVVDPESFWHLLDEGIDGITEMPRERWDVDALYDPNPDAIGKMTTRSGGFLTDIDRFDPAFFGISPREAVTMDPQQRLLLETSWEALEQAGIVPEELMGADMGVFVGLMYQDYGALASQDLAALDGHVSTGSAGSIASGRISYQLGVKGPSLTVDTACSSSLVTVHLACQALRRGECSMALAGGVALMLTPAPFVEFSRLRGLAPDGRSKSFSAAADGVAWSEGCGMLVLEKLSDARRHGHRVLGLVRGSAVNQDGRSNGLTAPNGPSQQDVIRRALEQAGLAPSDVDYVECHGTGTTLGDPIEVQALGAVVSTGRTNQQPVLIGSVKSNLGHTQAAAGAAGIMKVVLAMEHGQIPPNLHFDAPSPHIPWSELPMRVVSERMAWVRNEKPRRAGVSSFGISGTNAHVILEEAPSREERPFVQASSYLVPLSAKTPEALSTLAKSYHEWLLHHDEPLHDIAYTASMRRSHLEHRLSVVGANKAEIASALEAFATGELSTRIVAGKAAQTAPNVVFVFPGQGSQWVGMGRQLYREEPVFRDALMACDKAIREEAGVSIVEELDKPEETSRLHETIVAQPALFAMEVALSTLLQSWGIVPAAVLGHSVGEIAAAHVAGMLDLQQAAHLVCVRARVMQKATGQGKMISVFLHEQAACKRITGLEDRIGIAAINDPNSVVFSGDVEAIDSILDQLARDGVKTRPLRVNYAFHSPQMEVFLPEFTQALGDLKAKPGPIPMFSSVTGKPLTTEELDTTYWAQNIRLTVRFSDAISAVASDSNHVFVEVGPHPVLAISMQQTLAARNSDAAVVPTLRRESDERIQALLALGALHVRGYAPNWKSFFPDGGHVVSLPTYPWQRQRYWLDIPTRKSSTGVPTGHPLLGNVMTVAGVEAAFESMLDQKSLPWLDDHRVFGDVIVPGAALVEIARAASSRYFRTEYIAISGLTLPSPLRIGEHEQRRVQILLQKADEGIQVRIYSQAHDAPPDQGWNLHAQGAVRPVDGEFGGTIDLATVRQRVPTELSVVDMYADFSRMGLDYGSSFQGMTELRQGDSEAMSHIVLPETTGADAECYGIHPALLDAALQTAIGVVETSNAVWGAGRRRRTEAANVQIGQVYLPFEFGEITFFGNAPAEAWAHVRLEDDSPANTEALRENILLADVAGRVFASLSNVVVKRASTNTIGRAAPISDHVYRVEWHPHLLSDKSQTARGPWLLVGKRSALIERLEQRFIASGNPCVWSPIERSPEAIASGMALVGVVCLWDDEGDTPKDRAIPRHAEEVTISALHVVQALVRADLSARLHFVTRGAVAVDPGNTVSVPQSTLWGLGRVVRNEHDQFGCKLIDIDETADDSLWRELHAVDDETEIAWRNGKRLASRLVKATSARGLRVPDGESYALAIRAKGELSNLYLESVERRSPSAGEIEIEVHASGLNFRDVLNALGMYPGDAGPLGGECAGIVVSVGEGTQGFAIGDQVMALVAGAFRSFVTVDARLAVRIPRGLTMAQAAALPIVYLTAWYALNDLGELKRGERILVHAAAGGVGMAAVQIAKHIGAEVLATASPSKWDVVRKMGVETIANSRTVEFANTFGSVDVVLNSLAGEFVDAGLSLLAPGGRFLEMGKTDIRSMESINASHPGRRYRAFDLMEAGPERIHEMLMAIVDGFETRTLSPLPVHGFGLTEAQEAFRYMAQARHVGKIVLGAMPRKTMANNSTVLVTGGLGALGLHVARFLWDQHRIAHIVLAGRTAPTGEKLDEVQRLRSEGADIGIALVDVSDANAVRNLVASIPPDRPLRGVIHAAGVIDDGMIAEQTPERFVKVFAPKVHGAWNLHETTRHLPLDFFVMFSSAAGPLGNAGQSNYAAANAFLDALAHARNAEGLPAQSLQWGAWANGGMVAALSAALQSRIARMGFRNLEPAQGLSLLGETLRRPDAELFLADIDLRALEQAWKHDVPPLWRALLATKRQGAARLAKGAWRDRLATLDESARMAEISTALRADIAKVLSFGSTIDVSEDRPLQELGLDSLMAVELRNAISARAGKHLPATLLYDYPTIKALRQYLLAKVLVFESSAVVTSQPAKTIAQKNEPIVIVGVGCRFPGGVRDPEGFWRLLEQGLDAIGEVPRERWDIDSFYDPNPDAPGKMTTRWGGFLEDIDQFEPGFFGISPREAQSLDPQQRLLLETTWEALERAAIPADRLMGSDTGVYVGISSSEYQQRTMTSIENMDAYSLLGTAHSATVGRISYWLGLQGPNMAVDTACSSSLVSIHLACQALRSGECTMALAGGVNLVLSPEGNVYFSRLKAMSPTGRCHTFSSDADGYVRGEGCGMVVLKRLSDALRDGDSIWALIRATAVNQDGRSQGLTAPNGPAQEAVIRKALAIAGVRPADVDYVEAHGTGTPLGDPIEVQALASVLGEGRGADKPVVIGSVKTNIGHTEGAAGIAGLLKAALSLQYDAIPRSLHFVAPNPHIAWSEVPVKVATERMAWLRGGKPRIAGVSAFGFSGTNAHAILEEAPPREEKPFLQASSYILPLSAKTPEALSSLAKSYQEWLLQHDEPLHHVAYTASLRRSHFEHRLSVVGANKEEIASALGAFAAGEMPPSIVTGKQAQTPPKVVFVFPGQGSQWVGMGRQLYREESVFQDALLACDEAIRKEAGFSIIDELNKPEETARLAEIDVVQPVLFAFEVALAALWRAWGVEPSAVIGHSMGEVAAAFVAGAISMHDAAAIICRRSRLLHKMSGKGAMALVELSLPNVEEILRGYENRLSVAVSNGPRSTVIAGEPVALEEVLGKLEKDGVFCQRVKTNVASHSPQMDSLLNEVVATLGHVRPNELRIPMRSTVTGETIRGEELTAKYWADNLRKPVLFSHVVATSIRDGQTIFIEMSPHPALLPFIDENLQETKTNGLVLSSLRFGRDDRQTMSSSLGVLFTRGVPVDWKSFFPEGGKVVQLPTYPWQRERYWIELPNRTATAAQSVGFAHSANSLHPLLGVPFTSSLTPDARLWRQSMSVAAIPWLAEHKVQDAIVFPGTGYVECALEAASEALGGAQVVLEDVAFEQMMVFADDQIREVEVALIDEGHRKSLRISSQSQDARWTRHASGYIRSLDDAFDDHVESPHVLANRLPNAIDVAAYYERIRAHQMYHGHPFQGIVELRAGEREALAKIRFPEDVPDNGYVIHPALLDACFQVSGALASRSNADTFVPVSIDRLHVYRCPGRHFWVRATRSSNDDSACDLHTMDDDGNPLVVIRGLRLKRIEPIARSNDALASCVVEVAWQQVKPLTEPALTKRGTWLVIVDDEGIGDQVIQRLSALGQRCIRVRFGSSYERITADDIRMNALNPEDYRRIFKETFGEEDRCSGVVHLSSLDAMPFEQTTTESLAKDLGHASVSATYLTQAIVRYGFRDVPRLFFVTRGAQSVHSSDPVSVTQAPILGLGKTMAMEHPELRCTRIDLPAVANENDVDGLLRELCGKDREDQIALRGQSRYVARLVPARFEPTEPSESTQLLESAHGRAYRLEIHEPGVLDQLALYEMEVPQPGPHEVLIDVKAAGLNFLDVLAALGALPPETTAANAYGPSLGGECAGTIVAVGEGITDLVPGQEVLAMGSRAIGSRVIAQRMLVAKKPPQLSWQEAATLPVVFLTAHCALDHIGRLCAGERVLIHAGAGGVGLAAIQLAKRVGAEIFATAGSDEKRAYLRSLGVPHVLDSRSLRFVDEIKRITGGNGVDVVLNSLSGEFIPASLSLLRDYGRFVEIGKRDYFENKQIGLRPFLRNLSFSLVDLRGLALQRPERVGAMLRELVAMFEEGSLRPLPVRLFPCSRASEAFQFMAQAKHIGKIAIAMNDVDARIVPTSKRMSIAIRADRTYLLTGGLGGLGLSLALWLVDQGARHLMLVGRRGPNDEAATAIQSLEQCGAQVQCVQADVSCEGDVEKLFAAIRNDMPPVGGIVHAAMVLDDHTLLEQSEESFQKVYAPKALGAWNLHKHSAALKLDFFVMYSSAAGLMGSPGQANYSASNAYLDALCRQRARLGLPGMSIQWGAFSEVGGAAARDNRGQRLAYRGGASLSPSEGLEALRRLLKNPRPEVGIVRFDGRQWVEFYPSTADVPFFAELIKQNARRGKSDTRVTEILARLQMASPDERLALLEKHLAEQVGAILRIDATRMDRNAAFQAMGMDSLTALELRNRLEASLGVRPGATVVFSHPTLAALAAHLLDRVDLAHEPVDISDERIETSDTRTATGDWPLSSGQERLWFIERLNPGTTLYNVFIEIAIDGRIDPAILRQSFAMVARTHDVLRTTFPVVDGQAMARVVSEMDAALNVLDLRIFSGEDQQAKFAEIVRAHVNSCWDLERGPLWRATIVTREHEKHVLLLSMHHIIMDGWSIGVLLGHVHQIYRDLDQGRKPQLPSPPITYGRYALEQRSERCRAERQESILWWKERLDGLPRLDIPFAKKVLSPTHAGDAVNFVLPTDLVEAIKHMASAESTTLFTALLSAWATLLHRYTGQTDFPIGTVSAGRDRNELRDVVGFFVNTLVLRCAIQRNDTGSGLMQQLQRVVIDALQHENALFDEVVRTIKPSPHHDLNPLIQTCFVLENLHFPEVQGSHTRWQPIVRKADASSDGIAKFNLGLYMAPTAEGLFGTLEFATDMFERSAIERMVEHFQQLLRALVLHPHACIADLPLLTEKEFAQFSAWNDTTVEMPANKCIHELFAEQVAKTPDAIAMVFEDKHLTYADLDVRSNQLAHHLQSLGVGPEVLVAICVERSLEMVVGLLGILKAGGAYVPIDPTYPKERIVFMLEDARVSVLLTQAGLVETLPEHGAKEVVRLDVDADEWASLPNTNPVSYVNPDNAMYVIYTSGSTGLPKGVVVAHRGLSNLWHVHARRYDIAVGERVFFGASPSFDASMLELLFAFPFGATLIVKRADDARSHEAFLKEEHVSVAFVPPAILGTMGPEGSSLRRVFTGADICTAAMARTWSSSCILTNLYGPTEDSIYATSQTCSSSGTDAPPIGTPNPNTRAYVLDESLHSVPCGIPGELYLSGVQLARGYLNRRGLTAERFVPDPYSPVTGARMYRTGDLAQWNDGGALEFRGRIDDQVKIRGFRIELGEIEAVLGKHPAVRDCVVLAREDVPGDKRLVAHVVVDAENASTNDFREHLRGKLPDYMVPSTFVVLESLPLSPNGKVDRKALLKLAALPQAVPTRKPPRSHTEMVLVDLWEKILQVSPVGIEDDFFVLGGHSLLAVSLMSAIEATLGKRLPIATLLRTPTPETLARAIETYGESTHWSPIVPFHTTGSATPFFFVHPFLGAVMMYVPIARQLRPDRPCYGIQAPGLLEGSESFRDLEAQAAYYIEEMRKVQPVGPYLIGGYSYGGHVAVEIARQLDEQHQKVKCVVLLDTGSPDNLRGVDSRSVWSLLIEILLGMGIEVDRAHLDSLAPEQQLHYLRQRFDETNLLPPEISIERILGQLAAHQFALSNWKCRVTCPLSFFRPLDTADLKAGDGSELNDNAQGWKAASSHPVDVQEIPGNHFTMVREPHVYLVAERLRQCLLALDPLPDAREGNS